MLGSVCLNDSLFVNSTLADVSYSDRPFSCHFPGRAGLIGCAEYRKPGDEYYWDGLKRGGTKSSPLLVFQATVEGWGIYEESGNKTVVDSGKAFVGIIPSEHIYYLPAESPGWGFLWLIIQHKYVVSRIASLAAQHGCAVSFSDDAPLRHVYIAILKKLATEAYRTSIDLEEDLFRLMFAYERHLKNTAYEDDECSQILSDLEDTVSQALPAVLSVDEIARTYDMSRSHFSHWFRQKTGQQPATYMTLLRLRLAEQKLRETHDTLEHIAADTGFADANHFCKVFRRHYGISPGSFRKNSRTIRRSK